MLKIKVKTMESQYEMGNEIFKEVIVIGKPSDNHHSGFGIVYLVMDKNSGFILALKTLKKDQISISDFEKIKREIMPWMKVANHPNIVSVYSIDLDDNKRPYILMEPVFPDEFGRLTLKDFMDTETITEEQILKWSIQFCYAMEYVNQKKYVHGDIKPDNILIGEGIVKITDFGLAKSITDSSNEYYGSPFYLAPESWEGVKDVSSEIYSFGIILYQLCNGGELPFDGITIEDWKNFHKFGEIPKLEHDLFPCVKKCLNKDPKKRYSSFLELNEVLIGQLKRKFSQNIEKPKLQDMGNIMNMGRGHLAAIFGDIENCKKYYEMAIKNSDERITRYNYALDLIDLKQYHDALIQLRNLLDNPDAIPLERIYFNIGRCYHEKICLFKSIEYYKKAIEINKNDLKAHTNLGNVYKLYGLFDDALMHYNYVLGINDNFHEALVNITDLYRKLDDKENFDKYNSKLEIIEDTPMTVYHRGLLKKDEDILTFLTSMDRSTSEYMFQIPALIQLFEFHLSNGNWREADDIFDKIFELNGENINLMVNLCFGYKKFGFPTNAIEKMDYLYENCPISEKNNILFEKLILMKDYDKKIAISISKNLLQENISDNLKSKIYGNLGNIFINIDKDKSYDCYLKSLKFNSMNIFTLVDLAMFHVNNDEFFFAEEYIDRGLSINKNDFVLLFNKAGVCQDQFKYSEAIVYYTKCLKLNPTAKVYLGLSKCFIHLNEPLISLFYCDLAMKLCENSDFELYLMISYLMINFFQNSEFFGEFF